MVLDFEIQSGYLRIVREHGYRLPDDYLEYGPAVERIRGALAVRAEPTVACNNDLLAGNFIDDGDAVRLIDYEYSGNNDPCFELGNIWSECHLDLDQLEHLVTAYYGRHLVNKVARARLQGLMGQYGWTLWASIQEATSDLDFEFWPWGMEKYERAVATFRSPELDQLLEAVQRGVDMFDCILPSALAQRGVARVVVGGAGGHGPRADDHRDVVARHDAGGGDDNDGEGNLADDEQPRDAEAVGGAEDAADLEAAGHRREVRRR